MKFQEVDVVFESSYWNLVNYLLEKRVKLAHEVEDLGLTLHLFKLKLQSLKGWDLLVLASFLILDFKFKTSSCCCVHISGETIDSCREKAYE